MLELYYGDQIPADLFAEEQGRITKSIDALEGREDGETPSPDGLVAQFERVAAVLSDLDQIWDAATENEQRILLDEYVSGIHVFADHLEVEVRDAPKST